MKKHELKHLIRENLMQEVPDVLDKIKASPQFRVPPKPAPSFPWFTTKRFALSMTAIAILLITVFIAQFQTPVVAATVTLDVNPSIVITIGEDDKVISVSAVNDDGETVIEKDINYRGLTIDEVVDILVQRLDQLGYIIKTEEGTNVILIEVSAQDDVVRSRIEQQFQERLSTRMNQFAAPHWIMNARDIPLSQQQREILQSALIQNHMTRARLMLMYRINELDPSIDITSLQEKSIRELYGIFIELEQPENLPFYDQMPGHRDIHPPFSNVPLDPALF
jgi:hypothetical protein